MADQVSQATHMRVCAELEALRNTLATERAKARRDWAIVQDEARRMRDIIDGWDDCD